jgi:3-amino-5-hydroxybenzoate synthase
MKLAIEGGSPVRATPFPPWPQYDQTERDGLLRALDQGQWWRIGGSEVSTFEAEFAAAQGAEAALAVTNGTHALELALDLAGVRPGDEVIVPAFTFISTSNAVQRLGAVPVPVDVDLNTYCLLPGALEAARTERTRAVIPVHLAGHFAPLEQIGAWCTENSVALIQDAAHAHSAQWRGKRVGEFGSIACFSFQNGKLMTAGEGGAITLPSADLWEEAFIRHSCGRPPADTVYDHRTPSSNYRMNEFSAAVLRAQLRRLPTQIETRQRQWGRLVKLLADACPGVIPQGREDDSTVHPYYMAMFRLDDAAHPDVARDWLVQALLAEGLPAFVNYPPVYRTTAFWQGRPGTGPVSAEFTTNCPNSELLGSRGFWLHHRVLLGDDRDIEDVVRAITKILGAAATGRR